MSMPEPDKAKATRQKALNEAVDEEGYIKAFIESYEDPGMGKKMVDGLLEYWKTLEPAARLAAFTKFAKKRGVAVVQKQAESLKIDSFEQGWAIVQTTIDKVIVMCENDFQGSSSLSVVEQAMIKDCVYKMGVGRPPINYCQELYDKYKSTLEDYLLNVVQPDLRAKAGAFMLGEVGRRWTNHRDIMVKWLNKFFGYLDQYHTQREGLPSMYQTGMICFKDTMFPMVKNDLTTAIIDMVTREREGEEINRGLLRAVVALFVEMGLGQMETYEKGFEQGFLASSGSYYARLSAATMENTVLAYLQEATKSLDREKARVAAFLHPSTEAKLIKVLKMEMLEIYQPQLLDERKGLLEIFGLSIEAFDTVVPAHVAMVYKLFHDLPTEYAPADERLPPKENYGKAAVCKQLLEHIKALGGAVVEAEKAKPEVESDGFAFISTLVKIHVHFTTLFKDCCDDDKDFHGVLQVAYEDYIINDDEDIHFIPRLLSEYCNHFLTAETGKNVEVDEMEKSLDSAVKMYSYLKDKDYFNQHYKRTLANRLLHELTLGNELEQQFLSKIKQAVGAGQTRHQEAMIADVTASEKTCEEFAECIETGALETVALPDGHTRIEPGALAVMKGVECKVRVCNLKFWPEFRNEQLAAPGMMNTIKRAFEQFFDVRNAAKQSSGGVKTELSWVWSYGTAELHPSYGGSKNGFGNKLFKKFRMVLDSPYQLAVLLLFNEKDKWTGADMCVALNVEPALLTYIAKSLWAMKYKALVFDEGTDVYKVNKSFAKSCVNKKTKRALPKVKFPLPKKDHTEENIKIDVEVQNERRFAIDAVLVRNMKMNKVLEAKQLIPIVIKDLAFLFKADNKFVRKRIEHLVDNGFMQRDPLDARKLNYIA